MDFFSEMNQAAVNPKRTGVVNDLTIANELALARFGWGSCRFCLVCHLFIQEPYSLEMRLCHLNIHARIVLVIYSLWTADTLSSGMNRQFISVTEPIFRFSIVVFCIWLTFLSVKMMSWYVRLIVCVNADRSTQSQFYSIQITNFSIVDFESQEVRILLESMLSCCQDSQQSDFSDQPSLSEIWECPRRWIVRVCVPRFFSCLRYTSSRITADVESNQERVPSHSKADP